MRRASQTTTLFFFVLAALFIFILGNVFPSQRRAIFFFFSAPLQKTFWQAGERISQALRFFPPAKLQEEKQALWLENQALRAEVLRLKEFEEENKKLKEAFDGGLQKEFSLLPVRAIGTVPFEDVLFLDMGARDGIKKGMAVISSQKVLYGFVEEAFGHSARVALLSRKESSLIVRIAEDNISGVVRGQGGGRAILDLVPREAELREGGLLVTAQQENYPAGLLVGLVQKTIQRDVEPFLQAHIQLFFEKAGFLQLFVIRDF